MAVVTPQGTLIDLMTVPRGFKARAVQLLEVILPCPQDKSRLLDPIAETAGAAT
jgi:hypothetical protein